MIKQEIPKKPNGKIYKSKYVECQCEECGALFTRIMSMAIKDSTLCKSCSISKHNKSRLPEIKRKMVDAAANTWKGKTRLEVCGQIKAEMASKKQSISNSGKNNPNYGGKYSRGFADNPLRGTWDELFGEEESRRRKSEVSSRVSGKGNPMYGKPSPKKSGNGISGWWKNRLYFRSLLELAFILKCEQDGITLECAERKEFRFEYEFLGTKRTYVPDFVDAHGNLYECKPKKLLSSKIVLAKMQAAPNVVVVTDEVLIRPTVSELQLLINSGNVVIDKTKQWRIKE